MNRLVWVNVPWACFGFEIDEAGTIIATAPIAGWMLGKPGDQMIAYWEKRGAEIETLFVVPR